MNTPRFRAHESVRRGFRRIGSDLIQEIEVDLANPGEMEVHAARKRCKLLRALLRLMRSALPSKECQELLRRVRSLSRSLGRSRDAMVRLETFRRLELRDLDEVEQSLVYEAEQESRRQLRPALKRILLSAVGIIAKKWAEVEVASGGWRHIEEGMLRTYRRARSASRRESEGVSDEQIHAWRKRIKELMYQLRLIALIHPHRICKLVERLEDLDDALGGDHDTAVLRAHLHGVMGAQDPRWTATEAVLGHERKRLLHKAHRAAAKFFDEKPREFTGRLERRWSKWRKG